MILSPITPTTQLTNNQRTATAQQPYPRCQTGLTHLEKKWQASN